MYFIGEGKQPIHQSIFDYVKQRNTGVNSRNMKITKVSPLIHPSFTCDEVANLMTILQEWRINKTAEQSSVQEFISVHERIKSLPAGNKTRKTIVIDKEMGKRLDTY